MKNIKIHKILKIFSFILCIFNVILFFSMRCCWSGISKTLGYEKDYAPLILHLPLLIMSIMVLVALANIIYCFIKKRNLKGIVIFSIIDFLLLIGNIVIIALGAKDYIRFIFVDFLKALLVVAIAFILIYLIFIYPKSKIKDNKIFKYVALSCIIIASISSLVNFSVNKIIYEPVVYAVEDNYQIVFSTSSNSLGWIEVDGVKYEQLAAGSQKSYTKIHKVEVPMAKLDDAKSYTLCCQKMIYRGPFGGIKGKVLSKKYNFRPVDCSDGINYFALSDVHEGVRCSINTASYASDMEFLILAGDISSMVDTFADANFVNKLAFSITKGEIPVVYARGNHEIKGRYAEEFYKFVGSVNENFYYNFYLDDIYGMVLDIGEDHDDDWWEYYETANFDKYRNDQLELVKNEINSKNYLNYEYRMVVCHIPLMYVNARKNHESFKKEITSLLNLMDIHIALSGHQHDLMVFEPDTLTPYEKLKYNENYKKGTFKGYVTEYKFPNLLISKRGFNQTDSNKLTSRKSQIGLKVSVNLDKQEQTCIYLNSKGEKVNVVNPYVDLDYKDEITISMITKRFK